MACKTEEKTIRLNGEDRVLSVTQLPAMRAVKLFTRLGKIVGPSLAPLMQGVSGDVPPEKLELAVKGFFASVSEAEIEHLIADLLFEGARIEVPSGDGSFKRLAVKDVFANEFAGDLSAIVQAVGFALKVNFGSFFADLGAFKSRAEALIQTVRPSKTSSISSGKPNV